MSDWRVAGSLIKLRDQVNNLAPGRGKASDGTIGDPAHVPQGSRSDHNPWRIDQRGIGVVRALDITHDPARGMDTYALAERLRIAQDPRLANGGYVISNRRVFSGPGGFYVPWHWRTYTGSDPHTGHLHVSVSLDELLYDNGAVWEGIGVPVPGVTPQPNWSEHLVTNLPTLRMGSTGQAVRNLQALIIAHHGSVGATGIDGVFGVNTEIGLVRLQAGHRIPASVRQDGSGDGIAGPGTWTWLLTEV